VEVDLVADVDQAMPDWEALYAADVRATPFLSPGWARAWMRHWAPDSRPWLLRAREGPQVVGLAALSVGGPRPVRTLRMLGKEPGDYWDVLALPAVRAEVADAIARALVARRGSWDACVLSCLTPGSPLAPALAASAGLRVLTRTPVPCPRLELPATFDAYLAGLSRGRRGNLRRHLRRLDGELELREVHDEHELPSVMDRWQDLRTRQWRAFDKPLTAEHASRRFRDFMLAAVRNLLPSGQALVWEFRHRGEVVGVYVNLVDDRAFYWYLGGFDPSVAALGIGKIAIAEGIRSSIEQGRRFYDFTRGAEAYKYWYGARDTQAASLVVGHASLRSRAALAAAGVITARRDERAARQDGAARTAGATSDT
jgi:CelD/BcsL family acetyltransferase involved in cellulose biosynthesis